MSRTLRILESAQSDVDKIFQWIGRRSVGGAVRWFMAFLDAIAKVASSPDSFPIGPESYYLNRPLREALFKTRRGRTYRIVFELSNNEILVLRIRGPGQSPIKRRDLPS